MSLHDNVPRLADQEPNPESRTPVADRRYQRWGHRLLRNATALGPVALIFAIYSVLLDHLPTYWFAADWLRDAVSAVCALCVGLGLRQLLAVEPVQRALKSYSDSAIMVVPEPRTPSPPAYRHPRPASGASPGTILQATRRQLIADCREGNHNGVPTLGWSQIFGDSTDPSAIGTSYGIRLALLLDVRAPKLDRTRLLQTLVTLERPDGGWRARSQRGDGKPEVTAWVGTAAARLGLPLENKRRLISSLERMATQETDSAANRRTTVLTSVIRALAELAPDSPTLVTATDTLMRGGVQPGSDQTSGVAWGETCGSPRFSVPHTARAVIALAAAGQVLSFRRADIDQLLDAAIAWLVGHPDFGMFEEQLIRRPTGDEADILVIGHFTAAWVARALLTTAPERVGAEVLHEAIRDVIATQEDGVWRWKNTERRPLWMTYQGALVLRDFLLAGISDQATEGRSE